MADVPRQKLAMRRLHRQRRKRPAPVVMNQTELAEHFKVAESELKVTLEAAGWDYHEDGNGKLWASAFSKQLTDTDSGS